MDIGSQPYVVGEIPAGMVGIFVDDNVVGVPKPIVAVANVIGSDAEVESAEPETVGAASSEPPDVTSAKASREMAMLEGMVEVVVGIVGTGVVPDPLAIRVHVRGIGMAGLIVKVTVLLGRRRVGCGSGTWPMGWDVFGSATDLVTLRECHNRKQDANRDDSNELFHGRPFFQKSSLQRARRIVSAPGGRMQWSCS